MTTATASPTITISGATAPSDAFVDLLAGMLLEHARREIASERDQAQAGDLAGEDHHHTGKGAAA